jgi:hypothetical protein
MIVNVISDSATMINYVFNMFLNIEPIKGVTIAYILGFTVCMGFVIRLLTNDGD